MVKQSLKICHLYPRNMNIYGDTGNVITLQHRLLARGFEVEVVQCEVGEKIPTDVDIIVAGGGQDAGQLKVEQDLQQKQHELRSMVENNVVILTICGTYQLFGHRFVTHDQQEMKGIGVFDLETIASKDRMIGNTIIETSYGKLVGFENHSGKTYLLNDQHAFGQILQGAGNNGESGEEGAVINNTFGTYMHGPILPKNPHFADELLIRALRRKYGNDVELTSLPDQWERRAAEVAMSRPR